MGSVVLTAVSVMTTQRMFHRRPGPNTCHHVSKTKVICFTIFITMKQSEKTHVLIDQVRDLPGQMPSLVCLVEARADIGPKPIKASACGTSLVLVLFSSSLLPVVSLHLHQVD